MKGREHPEEFKREIVRLWRSKQMTSTEIVKKKRISSGLIYKWAKLFPNEGADASAPLVNESTQSLKNAAASADSVESSTAVTVRAPRDNDNRLLEKQRVYALIASGKNVTEVSRITGIAKGTIYSWRSSDRKKLVKRSQAVELESIESPSTTAVIAAAEKAHTLLKNARLAKQEDIRNNTISGNPFPDDFCLGQMAFNKLATVFGK